VDYSTEGATLQVSTKNSITSKLAPLPQYIESALRASKDQRSGFVFAKTYPDGKKEEISEAQVIEEVLQYLRSQTQLVIGYGVMIGDLKKFLRSNNIDP
jgi:2-succinyl-5-enolpyruvyl-6-hydroxy-3-cyclohexene-1-carboxylate synthase